MLILSTKLKNTINAHANGMDLTFTLKNISINGSKRGCSGFIRNNANGSVVYVNTERTFAPFKEIPYMYRYADNEKDYTGYHNRWANTLDELASAICTCLHSTPTEVNDRRI
jgi:hypothetical protein